MGCALRHPLPAECADGWSAGSRGATCLHERATGGRRVCGHGSGGPCLSPTQGGVRWAGRRRRRRWDHERRRCEPVVGDAGRRTAVEVLTPTAVTAVHGVFDWSTVGVVTVATRNDGANLWLRSWDGVHSSVFASIRHPWERVWMLCPCSDGRAGVHKCELCRRLVGGDAAARMPRVNTPPSLDASAHCWLLVRRSLDAPGDGASWWRDRAGTGNCPNCPVTALLPSTRFSPSTALTDGPAGAAAVGGALDVRACRLPLRVAECSGSTAHKRRGDAHWEVLG